MTDETIFATALEKADAAERAAYLDSVCKADPALRKRLDGLLAAHAKAVGFLERPAVAMPDAEATSTKAYRTPEAEVGDGETRTQGEVADEDTDDALSFLQPAGRPDSLGRIGHHEVLEVLGKGGFGIVFRAFDEVLQRVVAVKVLAPSMAATSPARKRFTREAQSAARIQHENVVRVHEVSRDDERLPYLVMEFISGETLQQRLDRKGPLEVQEVVRVGRQIAEGLAAAHEKGLIHRDIKPSNILIDRGPQEQAKITDFGLARAADDASLTRSGVVAGTPMYMAPEQAKGEALDHRADVFSLGSVLYAMLTGRPPFRAETTLAVLKRVAEDTPRPIREVIPEVPEWLCRIVEKLHAKDPADRFQTAKEVAEVLADCEKQLQAHGALKDKSRIPEAKPAPRRSRGKWATAAAILLGLGLLAVAGVVLWKEAYLGSVRVRVSSEGVAYIGKPDGRSELAHDRPYQLRPGRYTLSFERYGVQLYREEFVVGIGEHKQIDIPQVGTVRFELEDSATEILMEGVDWSPKPGTDPRVRERTVQIGKHLYTLRIPGHSGISSGRWAVVRGDTPNVIRVPAGDSESDGFVPLFNRKDLSGWTTGGKAGRWRVADGVLIGSDGPGFLFSEGRYRDFHLRVEAKLAVPGNGGINFRETLQAEINDKPTAPTGSLVVLAPGKPATLTPYPHAVVPTDAWFTLEIRAVGTDVWVRVNKNPWLKKIVETPDPAGSRFGLEVLPGAEIHFRKIEIRELPPTPPAEPWTQLFNRKDLSGWKPILTQPGDWKVEDGELVGRGPEVSHLVSERGDFQNFHLRAEVKTNAAGNSGIYFHSAPQLYQGSNLPAGIECEIHDNLKWPTGSFYIVGGGGSRIAAAPPPPADSWVKLEIQVLRQHLTITVNDRPVIIDVPLGAYSGNGHLALQVYNPKTEVRFRKIEIKELPATPEQVAGEDLAKLQGEWILRLGKVDQQPLSAQAVAGMKLYLLKDGKFVLTVRADDGYPFAVNGTYNLDAAKKQIVFDIKVQDDPVRCAYRVEGDKLVLDFPEPKMGERETGSTVLFAPDERIASQQRLKNLGVAMHNYMTAHNDALPQAATTNPKAKDGKPLLSWRVALLPYLEQEALYRQFKLDEPWDSEHNKKLIDKMPKVYAVPGIATKPGETHYRVFVGPGTAFEPRPAGAKGLGVGDFHNGLSNTILVAEAADSVIWTRPDDLPYDPKKPVPKLGVYQDGAHVLMGDGSVWRLSPQATEKGIRGAIAPGAFDAISDPHLRRIPWRGPAVHLEFQRGTAPQALTPLDREDLAKLKGEWVVRSGEYDGKAVPPQELGEMTFRFGDGTFEWFSGKDAKRVAEGTLRIEAAQKEIVLDIKTEKETIPVRCGYRLEGDRLRLTFVGGGHIAVNRAAEHVQSQNNLKQLALAMLQYEDRYKALPRAALAKDGKPLLSWRVALLPYFDQDTLYKQFKLDEPWDSEHNKKLIDKMPQVYRTPGTAVGEPGLTHYRVFTGPGTAFEALPDREHGVRLAELRDGIAKTLLIVEAADPVIWTKPDELPYDPKQPLPKLGVSGVAIHAAFCDLSIHALPPDVPEKALRAIITRNGDETVAIPVLLSAPAKDPPLHLEFQRRGPISDKDRLQGLWIGESGETFGQPLPAERVKQMRLEFTGGNIRVTTPGKPDGVGTFKLDPDANPREIDAIRNDDEKGMRGIYRLDGDKLTLCMGEPGPNRPREFRTGPDTGPLLLVTLRRAPAPPSAVAPFDASKAKEHQEAWARHLGVQVEVENSIGMKLRLIPPGTFQMGSPETDAKRNPAREEPRHEVAVAKPYYLGLHEVTQKQYQQFVGKNPSHFTDANAGGPDHPVEMVNYDEAVEFCQLLSALPAEKAAGRVYRLPTEAEWEYACRAGTATVYSFGDDFRLLDEYAWYRSNAKGTQPVGKLKPNAWGLFDMHGNVFEVCADRHDYAAGKSGVAPADMVSSRGGSWLKPTTDARSAYRGENGRKTRFKDVGIRVVCEVAGDARPPQPKAGLDAPIDGRWVFVSAEFQGKPLTEAENPFLPYELHVATGRWGTVLLNGTRREGTLRVREGKTPAQVEFTGSIFAANQEPGTLIYRLDGDRLTLCGGGTDPPTAFATDKASPNVLLVFRRATEKDKPQPKRQPEAVLKPLKDAVAAQTRTLETVKARYEVGTVSKIELLNAEGEVTEARIKLAEAEGDTAAVVACLEELVKQRQEERDLVAERFKAGVERAEVLNQADARLADAKARLAKARPAAPPIVAPEPRPSGK